MTKILLKNFFHTDFLNSDNVKYFNLKLIKDAILMLYLFPSGNSIKLEKVIALKPPQIVNYDSGEYAVVSVILRGGCTSSLAFFPKDPNNLYVIKAEEFVKEFAEYLKLINPNIQKFPTGIYIDVDAISVITIRRNTDENRKPDDVYKWQAVLDGVVEVTVDYASSDKWARSKIEEFLKEEGVIPYTTNEGNPVSDDDVSAADFYRELHALQESTKSVTNNYRDGERGAVTTWYPKKDCRDTYVVETIYSDRVFLEVVDNGIISPDESKLINFTKETKTAVLAQINLLKSQAIDRLSGNVHPSREYDKDLHNRICREEIFGEEFND